MNWEAIGAIGEIVGAVAVIATLAYLAVQIHSANKYAELEAIRFTLDGLSDYCDRIVESPQTASLLKRGRDGLDNLSPEEVLQFEHLHIRLLNTVEGWYYHIVEISKDGVFRKGQIENIGELVKVWLDNPGSREFWSNYKEGFPLVAEVIDRKLDELDSGGRT